MHAALQDLSATTEKLFNMSCSVECDPSVRIADNNTALHLYRIAQEAINNAVKHGKAQSIVVTLTRSNGILSLVVKDDGAGFPKSEVKSNGIGLRVMNYRAGMIGASLSIENQSTGGTIVSCHLQNGEPTKDSSKAAKSTKTARPVTK